MIFSDLFLTPTIGLIVGLIVYYSLCLVIVHMRAFLQPEIATKSINTNKVFSGYRSQLTKSILSSKRLHVYTLQYINPFSKISFPGMKIRKIDRWVLFFLTIIAYLIPFLIIGIIYLFLSLEIKGYISFDLPNTFYSTIQTQLSNIQEDAFFKFLRTYKIWFNLFLGILIVLIPLLLANRKRIKLAQKRFNQLLVCIGILTNITFFSGFLANESDQVKSKLAELGIKIENTHKRMYAKIAGTILIKDYEDLNSDIQEFEKLNAALTKNKDADVNQIVDDNLRKELENTLDHFIDSLRTTKVIIKPLKWPFISETRINSEFDQFKEIGKSYSKKPEKELDYFFNEKQWTYQEGIEMEKKVDACVAEIKVSTKSKITSTRINLLLDEVYSFILAYGIGAVTELVPETNNDICKVFFKSIGKATQRDILEQFVSILKGVKIYSKNKLDDLRKNTSNIKRKYASIIRRYTKEDRLNIQIKEWEQRIKTEIIDELISQIQQYVNDLDVDNISFEMDGITVTADQLTKQLKDIKSSGLQKNTALAEAILNRYKDKTEYKNLFRNNGNKRAYLQRLQNINVPKVISSGEFLNYATTLTGSTPIICPRCFQDINVAKFCLPLNPLLLK